MQLGPNTVMTFIQYVSLRQWPKEKHYIFIPVIHYIDCDVYSVSLRAETITIVKNLNLHHPLSVQALLQVLGYLHNCEILIIHLFHVFCSMYHSVTVNRIHFFPLCFAAYVMLWLRTWCSYIQIVFSAMSRLEQKAADLQAEKHRARQRYEANRERQKQLMKAHNTLSTLQRYCTQGFR